MKYFLAAVLLLVLAGCPPALGPLPVAAKWERVMGPGYVWRTRTPKGWLLQSGRGGLVYFHDAKHEWLAPEPERGGE